MVTGDYDKAPALLGLVQQDRKDRDRIAGPAVSICSPLSNRSSTALITTPTMRRLLDAISSRISLASIASPSPRRADFVKDNRGKAALAVGPERGCASKPACSSADDPCLSWPHKRLVRETSVTEGMVASPAESRDSFPCRLSGIQSCPSRSGSSSRQTATLIPSRTIRRIGLCAASGDTTTSKNRSTGTSPCSAEFDSVHVRSNSANSRNRASRSAVTRSKSLPYASKVHGSGRLCGASAGPNRQTRPQPGGNPTPRRANEARLAPSSVVL